MIEHRIVAQKFIECVNNQDLEELLDLLTVDHRVTDLAGDVVEGAEVVDGKLFKWRIFEDHRKIRKELGF